MFFSVYSINFCKMFAGRILICYAIIAFVAGEWVDPHDMNIKVKHKYVSSTSSTEKTEHSSVIHSKNHLDSELLSTYLKMIVNRIVHTAHIHKDNPEVYDGYIRFNMVNDDFQFLEKFGQGDITIDHLRTLHRIFSDSFKKSLITKFMDSLEWYQLKIYSAVFNHYNMWIFAAIVMLFFVYQLIKYKFSLSFILKYCIVMLLICDFCFRYKALLEEAEEHNSQVVYSAKCDTKKMSWGEYAAFIISSRNCETKTITPLDVFLFQVKNLIIIPLRAFGTGIGAFGKEMFTALPWGLNIIMFPLMLVFVIIVTIFLMAFSTGTSIELNLLHLFKLKFGGQKDSEIKVIGSAVGQLLNGSRHRNFIQELPSTKGKNKSNKITSKSKNDNSGIEGNDTKTNIVLNQEKEKEEKEPVATAGDNCPIPKDRKPIPKMRKTKQNLTDLEHEKEN